MMVNFLFPFMLASSYSFSLIQGSEVSASIAEDTRNIIPEMRIVGGKEVVAHAHPYLAFTSGNLLCGASLIWSDVLISAAHCAEAFNNSYGVYIGGVQLDGSDGAHFDVDKVLVNPQYPGGRATTPHDLLLVKLTTLSQVVPVQLVADATLPSEGESVKILGYGATSQGGSLSNFALEVNVQVANFDSCNANYSNLIQGLQFCTSTEGGKDSCQGDSGGPLLNSNGYLVGLVSYGVGCATPGIASVNTRVSAYADWIESGICQLSSNPPSSCNSSATAAPTKAPVNSVGGNRSPSSPGPIEMPSSVSSPTILPNKSFVPSSGPTLHPTYSLSKPPSLIATSTFYLSQSPSAGATPYPTESLSATPSTVPTLRVRPTKSLVPTAIQMDKMEQNNNDDIAANNYKSYSCKYMFFQGTRHHGQLLGSCHSMCNLTELPRLLGWKPGGCP